MPNHKPIPAILERLTDASRKRVAILKSTTSFESLVERGREHQQRGFRAALSASDTAIIAEIKKASPSKGVLAPVLDPARQALAYVEGGCAAISVVTEPEHFLGDLAWIGAIRKAVAAPVLRKDFIVDPIQVAETASSGADAILLIARILSAAQLVELASTARELGLEVLFETHDEADIESIMTLEPELIGVNARDLDNFSVDTERVARLRGKLPSSALLVAESGIERREQIVQLSEAGYHAFLVGEALLRATDPAVLLRTLRGEA